MESINKVELQGEFGSCNISEVGEIRLAKFSLCTKRAVKQDGEISVETLWHSCVAFEKSCRHFDVLESLAVGDAVHVVGRLKYSEFIDNNNFSRMITEIIVRDVEKINRNWVSSTNSKEQA